MNLFQLIKRDIIYYRKSLLATMLLATVCSAILTGGLLVGDSVQHTLKRIGRMRTGSIRFACSTADRFFRQQIADEFSDKSSAPAVPVLALKGILESADGAFRVNNVNIYGVDDRFWTLADSPAKPAPMNTTNGIAISESVAARLGDENPDLLLRILPAASLSRDLIFSTEISASKAWPVTVAGTIPDTSLGRFSLQASQEPPLNVFVPIEWLAAKADIPGMANLLLVADTSKKASVKTYNALLKEAVRLEDLGFKLNTVKAENVIELRTPRIFIDDSIARAALETGRGAYGIFTHLVNEIRIGSKSVPYSMVSAIASPMMADLRENQIIINEWLANELKADVGDVIVLQYYRLTDTRHLVEETADFTVAQVVPMMGSFADPTLMPDYPGMSEADSCRNWESGLPIDLDKIDSKDEQYWDQYKGTPKAFISIKAAHRIWDNRFGTFTSIRWPASDNTLEEIQAAVWKNIQPEQIGFAFSDIKKAARQSAAGSTDFSGLFAGLSMFLICSAAILLALVFAFYIESRSEHLGLFQAVGFSWTRIFKLCLAEGAVAAIPGCAAGAVVSVLYTAAMIAILNVSFWTKAVASLHVDFSVTAATLIRGAVISFLICLFAIQAALFHRLRRPAHQLLTGTCREPYRPRKRTVFSIQWAGWLCLFGGIFISLKSEINQAQVASFFLAGTLCLAGVLMILAYWLGWLGRQSGSFARSLEWLAVKNLPRRLSRTVAVLISLSCGVFLVVSVGANYKEVASNTGDRRSGTGGFELMAQATLPMAEKLSLPGDNDTQIPAIAENAVVSMRLYQQDEASCLNLNRAQYPTLLGVNVAAFETLNPFTFQSIQSKNDLQSPWALLSQSSEDGAIPAIGDYATVYWGLGGKLGETIESVDEKGGKIYLKIVGILKESVLQGRLLISEQNFLRQFPSVDGYSFFLIDADAEDLYLQAKQLTRRYRDAGIEVVSTAEKLAQFNEVENTYLMIFLILGGLGLVLGSLGLGFVLVLNVLDRRAELAMMQAVGFRIQDIHYMLFVEHGLLLAAGILCGLVPALWAVMPSIVSQGRTFPAGAIGVIIVGMLVCGAVWIQLAGRFALKKNFLDVLKNQ